MELADGRQAARGTEKHYNFYKLFISVVSPGLTRSLPLHCRDKTFRLPVVVRTLKTYTACLTAGLFTNHSEGDSGSEAGEAS